LIGQPKHPVQGMVVAEGSGLSWNVERSVIANIMRGDLKLDF